MNKTRYVAGLRAVEQLLSGRATACRCIHVEYATKNPRVTHLIELARKQRLEVHRANRSRLAQISGISRHQGIVAELSSSTTLDEAQLRSLVERRLETTGSRKLLLLVLDGIQDPHNLGACLRTAEAAGVDAVIAPRRAAAGLSASARKVAAGAAETIPFAQVGSLSRVLDWLRTYGVHVCGTSEQGDIVVYDSDLDRPLALVMGREEKGISKAVAERCDCLLGLPMLGEITSLNVSVATGIFLFEVQRQRRARGD